MQKEYKDLEVWQKCRELARDVYTITKLFPKDELFGLTNQISRSAVAVPSNIAEGCGRNHTKDSLQFFYIASGSLYELETQIYISFDQAYINLENLNYLLSNILTGKKLLNGFIKYFSTLQS
ncbi:MAG: ribosomal protein [Adhaeribacter sp.]|nr:ribosomal protein [Adhaeribacter sp.]